MRYLIAMLLLSVLATACSDETKVCDQSQTSLLGMNFKKDSLDGFINIDTIWPKITAYPLDNAPGLHDTVANRLRDSTLHISLNPDADSSRYYLQMDSTATPDTITFRYKRSASFVSPGCGFATFFTLDTVICTFHTFDYLKVNNRQINASNDIHLSLVTIAR